MYFKNASRWYVYELADPTTGQAFYVGKGAGNRIDHHERESARGVCSKKCNKIKAITRSGKQILKRKVAYFWCEQAAYDHETDLISAYGLKNLTNILPGGQRAFERRVKEKKQRIKAQAPIDPVDLIKKAPHIIKDWAELTENGRYKVEAVLTGNPFQDAISKMAATVYNKCIQKVLMEALEKNGGRLEIGCA